MQARAPAHSNSASHTHKSVSRRSSRPLDSIACAPPATTSGHPRRPPSHPQLHSAACTTCNSLLLCIISVHVYVMGWGSQQPAIAPAGRSFLCSARSCPCGMQIFNGGGVLLCLSCRNYVNWATFCPIFNTTCAAFQMRVLLYRI